MKDYNLKPNKGNKMKIHFLMMLIVLGFSLKKIAYPLKRKSPLTESSKIDLLNVVPLTKAYAHNDYWHKRPLLDALSNGFTAIEVDVHLKNNQLRIGHKKPLFLKKRLYLTQEYLQPLWILFKTQNGHIYPNYSKSILLVIDIKTDALFTSQVIINELKPYRQMLTHIQDGHIEWGAVTILISGNRPTINDDIKMNYIFLDGRFDDILNQHLEKHTLLVSENWKNYFPASNRKYNLTKREFEVLKILVKMAHSSGKKFRLWNSPENKKVWRQLLAAGVDYINTDDLEQLSLFLTKRPPTKSRWVH